MKLKIICLAATTMWCHIADAALVDNGNGLIYESVSNVTWTQDLNLLKTLENNFGYTATVNAIIANTPIIYDTPNAIDGSYIQNDPYSGKYSLSSDDFAIGGLVDWWAAKAFVSYLNSINYDGSTNWRLPTYGSSCGNDPCGNEQFYSDDEFLNLGHDLLAVSSPKFNNGSFSYYWADKEYSYYPGSAWRFWLNLASQNYDSILKTDKYFALAVTPGNFVSTVPLPPAIAVFVTGLLGLSVFGRKKT